MSKKTEIKNIINFSISNNIDLSINITYLLLDLNNSINYNKLLSHIEIDKKEIKKIINTMKKNNNKEALLKINDNHNLIILNIKFNDCVKILYNSLITNLIRNINLFLLYPKNIMTKTSLLHNIGNLMKYIYNDTKIKNNNYYINFMNNDLVKDKDITKLINIHKILSITNNNQIIQNNMRSNYKKKSNQISLSLNINNNEKMDLNKHFNSKVLINNLNHLLYLLKKKLYIVEYNKKKTNNCKKIININLILDKDNNLICPNKYKNKLSLTLNNNGFPLNKYSNTTKKYRSATINNIKTLKKNISSSHDNDGNILIKLNRNNFNDNNEFKNNKLLNDLLFNIILSLR